MGNWHSWLDDLQEKYDIAIVLRIIAQCVGLSIAFLGFIALMSDIGFSEEITTYRAWLNGGAITLAIILIVGKTFYDLSKNIRNLRRALTDSENSFLELSTENHKLLEDKSQYNIESKDFQELNNSLQSQLRLRQEEVTNLEAQNNSLLRLMESYKVRAQENLIDQLERLLIANQQQQMWRELGAKITGFRIEPPSNLKLDFLQERRERVTVYINLGSKHRVMKGMTFIVREPTDETEYGMIVVREVRESGSVCAIMEIKHEAFWSQVNQAVIANEVTKFNAPDNNLTPTLSEFHFDSESGEQLLRLLRSRTPD